MEPLDIVFPSTPELTEKKNYSPPQLTCHGVISEQTENNIHAGADAGGYS